MSDEGARPVVDGASAEAIAPDVGRSFVYLASQSPRRAQLLDQIGVRHVPLLAGADEDAEALEAGRAGESPRRYVERVTRAKLHAAGLRLAARGLVDAPILCADTTVVLGRRSLGKPRDAADAAAMLARLSGRTHRVVTVVGVASACAGERYATSVSTVCFARLDAARIERYVASGEPFGKAGAYAIQSAAAAWIARIDGSHSGIMGLPLHETAELLIEAGVALGDGRFAPSDRDSPPRSGDGPDAIGTCSG